MSGGAYPLSGAHGVPGGPNPWPMPNMPTPLTPRGVAVAPAAPLTPRGCATAPAAEAHRIAAGPRTVANEGLHVNGVEAMARHSSPVPGVVAIASANPEVDMAVQHAISSERFGQEMWLALQKTFGDNVPPRLQARVQKLLPPQAEGAAQPPTSTSPAPKLRRNRVNSPQRHANQSPQRHGNVSPQRQVPPIVGMQTLRPPPAPLVLSSRDRAAAQTDGSVDAQGISDQETSRSGTVVNSSRSQSGVASGGTAGSSQPQLHQQQLHLQLQQVQRQRASSSSQPASARTSGRPASPPREPEVFERLLKDTESRRERAKHYDQVFQGTLTRLPDLCRVQMSGRQASPPRTSESSRGNAVSSSCRPLSPDASQARRATAHERLYKEAEKLNARRQEIVMVAAEKEEERVRREARRALEDPLGRGRNSQSLRNSFGTSSSIHSTTAASRARASLGPGDAANSPLTVRKPSIPVAAPAATHLATNSTSAAGSRGRSSPRGERPVPSMAIPPATGGTSGAAAARCSGKAIEGTEVVVDRAASPTPSAHSGAPSPGSTMTDDSVRQDLLALQKQLDILLAGADVLRRRVESVEANQVAAASQAAAAGQTAAASQAAVAGESDAGQCQPGPGDVDDTLAAAEQVASALLQAPSLTPHAPENEICTTSESDRPVDSERGDRLEEDAVDTAESQTSVLTPRAPENETCITSENDRPVDSEKDDKVGADVVDDADPPEMSAPVPSICADEAAGVAALSKVPAAVQPKAPSAETTEATGKTLVVTTWEIEIDRRVGKRVGVDVDEMIDGQLLVKSVTQGDAMEVWNRENPSKALLPGDRIIAVNGRTENLIEECRKQQLLTMAVMRQA